VTWSGKLELMSHASRSKGVPAVPWPTVGVRPAVALATAIHAAPGVYSFLLGSGISRAAGVPTGWEVTQDLIRRVAVAEGSTDPRLTTAPEVWWQEQGRGEARYDELLAAIAQTDAARQMLLRNYFDTAPDGARLAPTSAHRSLAQLVAQGRVRVIVTTNFDRLTERALDEVGISAQVIASPDAVDGMIPLVHSPVTVLKIHGDYASLPLRNTPTELATYPEAWRGLLGRILDEYGQVVIGWSAEWDVGLVRVLTASPNHRYPTFWAARRGVISEAASRVIANRGAVVVPVADADTLFRDLAEQLGRLDARATRSNAVVYRRTPLLWDRPQRNGWSAVPLLVIRITTQFAPATADTMGTMVKAERERIAQVAARSSLTERVRDLAVNTVAVQAEQPPTPSAGAERDLRVVIETAPLDEWRIPLEAYLTTTDVTLRLGGDAGAGISALLTVRGPSAPGGDGLNVTCDIGISVATRVELIEVALLMRDGLMLLANDMPTALQNVLPADAEPTMFGLIMEASPNALSGAHRDNDLDARVDLAACGRPTRPVQGVVGHSLLAPDMMTESLATTAVLGALNRMFLDRGYAEAEVFLDRVARHMPDPRN
jgi:hypothetical protein